MPWSKICYAALLWLLPLSLHAGIDCNALKMALKTSQSLETYIKTTLHKTPSCSSSRAQNGETSIYCFASFAFRVPAAKDALALLNQQLKACFEPVEMTGEGLVVNHPDSFTQTLYCTSDSQFSLSLKDKGGLQKTLVFVTSTQASQTGEQCSKALN